MFEDEADTISVDLAIASSTSSTAMEMFRTQPFEAVGFDSLPTDVVPFDDTDRLIVNHPTYLDAGKEVSSGMIVGSTRASTDGEWPPQPKPPGHRLHRRAGVYRAITGISKLTKI